jgi:hypothetical protein
VGILGGEEMDALEEAVVDLQEEVMALRQVVTLLLAQHAANSPNALPGLRALLNESIQCDDETQMEGVRAHPRSLDSRRGVCSKSPEHDADHGKANEGSNGCRVAFEVAGQTAIATDPCERPFDNPSFRQDLESSSI